MMIVEEHDVMFGKWAMIKRCWRIEACHKVAVMAGFKEANHGVEWWVRTCGGYVW